MRVLAPAVTSLIPMTALHPPHTLKLFVTSSNSFSLYTYYSISYLNTFNRTIKFTSIYSNLSPFSTSRCLSIMVSIMETVLYTKPTLTARRTTVPLILRSSCHRPLHTSSVLNASFNFSFSVALGKRRICSSNKTFKLRCNELPHRLGYNLGLLNQEIPRVHTITDTLKHTNPAKP